MDPFDSFPFVFGIVPIIIGGVILVAFVKGIAEWNHNNGQPVLTVPARLVAKRTNVSSSSSMMDSDDSFRRNRTSTWYYVTYELDSGERREFGVRGQEYGLLAEGDVGMLTYQGTRYKGFMRGGVSA